MNRIVKLVPPDDLFNLAYGRNRSTDEIPPILFLILEKKSVFKGLKEWNEKTSRVIEGCKCNKKGVLISIIILRESGLRNT